MVSRCFQAWRVGRAWRLREAVRVERWGSALEPGDVVPPPAPAVRLGVLSHRPFGGAGALWVCVRASGSETSVERLNETRVEGGCGRTGYPGVLAACAE